MGKRVPPHLQGYKFNSRPRGQEHLEKIVKGTNFARIRKENWEGEGIRAATTGDYCL